MNPKVAQILKRKVSQLKEMMHKAGAEKYCEFVILISTEEQY